MSVTSSSSTDASVAELHPGSVRPALIDVRGPRFAAWITTAVLATALVVSSFAPIAAGLLVVAQGIVFALGATLGPGASPYGLLFRRVVLPRIAPTTERETVAPVRFAQAVGLGFAVIGAAGLLSGLVLVGQIAVGFALIAALLNAAFAFCMGCELYPYVARLRRS